MVKKKQCTKCRTNKPLEQFYRSKASSDGHASQCKACQDATRTRNRAKVAAQDKEIPRTKVCSDCGRRKKADDFSANPSSKDGLYSYCKRCKADRVRNYVDRNRDDVNRKARERGATPEGRKATRDANLKVKFGVTHDYYADRLVEQGGGCAICGRRPVEGQKHFAIDHSHNTKLGEPVRLRGVLCHDCNRALGLAKDDPKLLVAAARYLEKHKP